MKMPVGWKKQFLEEVATVQTGVAKNENIKGPYIEVPYLRVANVQDGHVDLSEIKTIQVPPDRLERYRLYKGDVLLTEGGDFDKLGRGTVWYGQIKNCVHQNHIFVVRPKKEILSSEFLSLQTSSPHGKVYFQSCSKQSTNLASVNTRQVKKFTIFIPPLPEQRAIAELLSTWDSAIEKTKRMILLKERQFEYLLDLLINKGSRKKEWRKVKLGTVGEISSAGVDKKIKEGEAKVRLLNYLDVYRRDLIYANELNHIVTASKEKIEKCSIRKGDIFFTPSSETNDDIGHSAVAMENIDNGVYSYHIVRLRLNEDWDLLFRAYIFKSRDFYKQAQELCAGSGQRYVISQTDFRNMFVNVPPRSEQVRIGLILSTSQNEIAMLKKIVEKYKVQKRGLMQKLLTGTWRVRNGRKAHA